MKSLNQNELHQIAGGVYQYSFSPSSGKSLLLSLPSTSTTGTVTLYCGGSATGRPVSYDMQGAGSSCGIDETMSVKLPTYLQYTTIRSCSPGQLYSECPVVFTMQ